MLRTIQSQDTESAANEVVETETQYGVLQPHRIKINRLSRDPPVRTRTTVQHALPKSVHYKRSVTPMISMSSCSTALGTIFIRKILVSEEATVGLPHTSGAWTFEEIFWIFIPWFCSHYIRAHYSKASGLIQASFRIYPLISSSHPIWKMCETGNLLCLQAFFDDRTLSPFGVNSKGMTLLHVSFSPPNTHT